jgi:hypothetical protein
VVYVPHYLVSLNGDFITSGIVREIFSMNLRFGGVVGTGFTKPFVKPDTATVDAVAAAAVGFMGRATSKMCNVVNLKQVKVNRIDEAGAYTDPTSSSKSVLAPGTLAHTGLPYSVAMAISHISTGRGPARRGRVFLPMPALAVGTNGRFATADLPGVLTSYKTMIDEMGAALGAPLIVASRNGFSSPVVQLRAGDVPDTQRRRRNDLLEAYSVLATAVG